MRAMSAAFVLSLTLLTGCATSQSMLVRPQSDPGEQTLGSGRQRIAGYTLRGGQQLSFDGYVEARNDTLRFIRPRSESRGLELPKATIVRDIPRDSVIAVSATSTDVPASVLLGVGLLGLVALFAGLAFESSFHPFGP